nr:conserved hypothetical protein [uncultured bacterium]
MNQTFHKKVSDIIREDPRYKTEAYEFVMEGLTYAQKKARRIRHVSGEELLDAMRELLLKQFGPLTLTVLHHWGIRKTEDFGYIVFNLVSAGILSKEDDDSFQSFCNGYDFEEAFQKDYRRQLEKTVSRLR